MPEYKVGDLVRATVKFMNCHADIGQTLRIVAIREGDISPYRVEMIAFQNDAQRNQKSYWLGEDCFEPV